MFFEFILKFCQHVTAVGKRTYDIFAGSALPSRQIGIMSTEEVRCVLCRYKKGNFQILCGAVANSS